jgi:Glycosyltransferase family 87
LLPVATGADVALRGDAPPRPGRASPFAYYAYLPFAAILPTPPAIIATLLPAMCFDALTLAGLHTVGRRLGGRPLANAFVFAYLLCPFPDLSLTAQTNDALIAALCVWTIAAATERPVARGILMAAAALTKFLPVLLAVQFLGIRRGRFRYALTLASALLIGAQLLLGYWFYSYVTWWYPLVIIAAVRVRPPRRGPTGSAGRGVGRLGQRDSVDGERDLDVAPGGDRVRAALVGSGHQVGGLRGGQAGRVQIQRDDQPEAAVPGRADPDPGGDL